MRYRAPALSERIPACGARLTMDRRSLFSKAFAGGSYRLDIFRFPAPAQNLRHQHRMIETFQVQIVDRTAFDERLDHAVDAPGDDDLVRLGFVAQAGGEVGDAADRGVFE